MQLTFSGDYILAQHKFTSDSDGAALSKFLCRLQPLLYFQSHLQHWAASSWCLSHISSFIYFFTRDSIYAIAHICYHQSVCPSVRQSKTVEARITKFLPYSSSIPLVFQVQVSSRNSEGFPQPQIGCVK